MAEHYSRRSPPVAKRRARKNLWRSVVIFECSTAATIVATAARGSARHRRSGREAWHDHRPNQRGAEINTSNTARQHVSTERTQSTFSRTPKPPSHTQTQLRPRHGHGHRHYAYGMHGVHVVYVVHVARHCTDRSVPLPLPLPLPLSKELLLVTGRPEADFCRATLSNEPLTDCIGMEAGGRGLPGMSVLMLLLGRLPAGCTPVHQKLMICRLVSKSKTHDAVPQPNAPPPSFAPKAMGYLGSSHEHAQGGGRVCTFKIR